MILLRTFSAGDVHRDAPDVSFIGLYPMLTYDALSGLWNLHLLAPM